MPPNDHPTLRQLSKRTVRSLTDWIVLLAKFHHRSPDQLGNPGIGSWLLHLINERKLSASTATAMGHRPLTRGRHHQR